MIPAALGLLFLLRYVLSKLMITEEAPVHAPVKVYSQPRVGTLVGK
jgi:hypothetical protein